MGNLEKSKYNKTEYPELMFRFNDFVDSEEKSRDYLDALYTHILKHNISNIYLCSNDCIVVDRNKHKVVITEEPLPDSLIKFIIAEITGGVSGLAQIYEGKSLDRASDFRVGDQRVRFRINIMRVYHLESDGIQITIRKIDFNPPPLSEIGFSEDDEIYQSFFNAQGLSLVTGPTGSGKSTTLASFIDTYGMNVDNHCIFNCYEEPIEYVHDNINKNSKHCRVYQTEVPTGIINFTEALKRSLRRQPEIIMVGELRDPETIHAAIEAGLTGHLVLSTAHTNGVPATVRRLVTTFNADERESRQVDILEQLNIIVAQRLLRTVEGGKVAVREHLIFTDEIRDRLQKVDSLKLNVEVRKIMNEKRNGMLIHAKRLLDKNIIPSSEYKKIMKLYQSEYEAAKVK